MLLELIFCIQTSHIQFIVKPVNLYLSDSNFLSFWNCALMHLVVQGSEIVWFFPPSQSSLILHSTLSHSQNSELSVRNWHWIQSPHRMTTKQHDVLHHFVELIISFVSGMSSFRVLLQRKQFCKKKHYKSEKQSWQQDHGLQERRILLCFPKAVITI